MSIITIAMLALQLAADGGLTREEARELSSAAMVDLEADAIIADPKERAVVLSAALCEARDRVQTSWDALVAFKDKPSRKAWERARAHVDRLETALGILEVEQVSCSAWDVSPLVVCLGPVPDLACSADPHMRAMVEAANRLMHESTSAVLPW